MSFIIGLVTGFILFPTVVISAAIIYGVSKGIDKNYKKDTGQNISVEYIKKAGKVYVNKNEINNIINKSKMC